MATKTFTRRQLAGIRRRRRIATLIVAILAIFVGCVILPYVYIYFGYLQLWYVFFFAGIGLLLVGFMVRVFRFAYADVFLVTGLIWFVITLAYIIPIWFFPI